MAEVELAVTKKEIASKLARETGLTQVLAKNVVQRTLDMIRDAILQNGRIELRNFGVLEVRRRKPRKARNPKSGAKIEAEGRNVIYFRVGGKLRDDLQKVSVSGKGKVNAQA